jgi:galactokinase
MSSQHHQSRLFRAPGRVNLIGEHTDYNDGFVMPLAIGFSAWINLRPLAQRRLEIFSENFGEQIEFELEQRNPQRRGHWSDYVTGVAVMLEKAGHRLQGAAMRIRSDVPIGSGLSSSAAIEVATACALTANSELNLDRRELAKLCQRAENEFVGARVGIMDQFTSLFGQANRALLLDCRSLEYKLYPLSEKACFVVCNTMVKHKLASSEYNQRRAQCEAGVKHLSTMLPNVTALRDVSLAELEEYRSGLPELIYRRCRHVVSENGRVLAAGKALEADDLARFGALMNESHRSLRDDYEVSCRELDLMVELAGEVDGVYGARMTGGGFGGCTVTLIANQHVSDFKDLVATRYRQATGLTPEIYVCEAAAGAEEVANLS